MSEEGLKFDTDKPRYDLIPSYPLSQMACVLTYGAAKYAPDNWRHVDDADKRYYSALMRHLESWRQGEKMDSETNLPHLAHALCNVMFLLELDS
jgi:hypothetical protein